MRTVIALMALVGVSTAAFGQAQGPTPVPKDASLYFGVEDLDKIEKSVAPDKTGKPAAFSKRLFSEKTFSTAFIRLNAPDKPHAHGTWSEVFMIKSGSGILETGGKIVGDVSGGSATHQDIFVDQAPKAPPTPEEVARAKAAAARALAQGDLSGTDVIGGKRQRVKPGDFILVPAGVSHRWVQIDEPIVYLDVKFPKHN